MNRKLQGMNAETTLCVTSHLAVACDQLGEAIAFMSEKRSLGLDCVEAAFTTLYKLRAEIGFLGGQVTSDLVNESEDAQ